MLGRQTVTKETRLQKSVLRRSAAPGGLGQDSLRGGAHVVLPGRAGVMPPPPLAASIAVFRSCIHFSFSSRVLRGEGRGSVPAGRAPCCANLSGTEVRVPVRPLHPVLWVQRAVGNAAGGQACIPLRAAGGCGMGFFTG